MAQRRVAPGGEAHTARRARQAALTIVLTMLGWLALQRCVVALGWPPAMALLFDFAALAGLFWALCVTYQIWQSRRADGADRRS